MKIIVIIPTYNEKESIGGLLDSLFQNTFKQIPQHQTGVLVVDGNSPDGTSEVVKAKAVNYTNLNLLVEAKKQGLGIAYAAGMKHAIKNLAADAIIEFDGDGQHDPEDIVRMVAELDNGYDYVIGSRYIAGGSIPTEWALYRKLLSRLGGLTAKFVLGLPVNDATSGFKLARVANFAENLPLEENLLLSKYYAYKIHFLHDIISRGAKTKEIPIQFLERSGGTSKSTLKDIFDSLRVVLALRFRK